MATSINQLHSEHDTPAASDLSRHTASPESVGASVKAWLGGAHLELSPAVFAITIVGAFALGVILVTMGLALAAALR